MRGDPAENRPHVVVVDDEEELCELIAMRLEHHGYRVTTRRSGKDALRLLELESADAMLLDMRLDQEDGIDVLIEAQKRVIDVPIVVLTAHASIELALAATKVGAFGFLTKPFDHVELLSHLARAVDDVRSRRELSAREAGGRVRVPERLIGVSPRISALRETIARAAPSEATILILGESGTGKEVAARTIHAASGRSGRFVAVNCGALPPDLLESELFGYRRGAFTGAVRDKDGLFAAADGGTLFLDEVGDAPLSVQVKLLRVLQERSYLPIGAVEPRSVDVRVVAATHRDLRADIAAGRFREDLFYRLHVLPIQVPPLRERREDVPLLAEVFLRRAVTQYRLSIESLSRETRELLRAHDWPGNVRQLANVIEAAALMCTDSVLRPAHIEAVLPPGTAPKTIEVAEPPMAELPGMAGGAHELMKPLAQLASLRQNEGQVPPLREARVAFDRAYLTYLLRRTAGNVSAAARLAGRNRTDFYDLLHRYDLDPLDFRRGLRAPSGPAGDDDHDAA